ncbi:MAG: hypothetical protein R6W68_05915 [Ignavibacteriaceae bacterium]
MRIYLYFLAILFGINLPVFSQIIHSDVKSLSTNADIILTGKVSEQKSEWNSDNTRIYTKVTIDVEEYLKGSNGQNKITITHPGGEVGEVGELYSHMPRFSNDEEVLLFVKEDRKTMSYKVLSGEDGKLTLYRDKITGESVTSFNKKVSTIKREIKNYVEQY